MATKSFSVTYRPIKIAFLLNENSVNDVVLAAGLNSLLYGGIYNPLIPVNDLQLADELVTLFKPDILIPLSHSNEVNNFLERHKNLECPIYDVDRIFNSQSPNEIIFFETANIIKYLYDKEFKFKSYESENYFNLLKWNSEDPLKNLFALTFGYYPDINSLQQNYERLFLEGTKGNEVHLDKVSNFPENIIEKITPIHLTGIELTAKNSNPYESGVYFGNEENTMDLINFWNLRASGICIEFYPISNNKRLKPFIQNYLVKLEEKTENNFFPKRSLSCYYDPSNDLIIDNLIKSITANTLSKCSVSTGIWNGLNIKPTDFVFEDENVLGDIDQSSSKLKVTIPLPRNKILEYSKGYNEYYSVGISQISEFSRGNKSIILPNIPELNKEFGREISIIDYDKVRIASHSNLDIITNTSDTSIAIYPLEYFNIISKVFKYCGMKIIYSQAGLIANRILEQLNGLEAVRVFKIKGVRKLIEKYRANTPFDKSDALKNYINNDFTKYERLYIEKREKEKLTSDQVFAFLIKKEIIRSGYNFKCLHCNLQSWLTLKEIDNKWVCHYCGFPNNTALELNRHSTPSYIKNGLFARDNNQEGAIPVLLTLLQMRRELHTASIYITSVNITIKKTDFELDFVILDNEYSGKVSIGIGECKSAGSSINQNDINNMKLAHDAFTEKGLDCYFIFSKTSDNFLDDEIKLFDSLKKEDYEFILMTNNELEPYKLLDNHDSSNRKFPFRETYKNLAWNTKKKYLNKKT